MYDLAAQLQFTELVLLAMALGGVIGLERELSQNTAGLRTHMLVAGASAAIVLLGDVVLQHLLEITPTDQLISMDPGRVLQAVFVGIGFIGAGVIIKSKKTDEVRHLSTAASILFAGTVGVASAYRLYLFAALLALLSAVINFGLYKLEKKYLKPKKTNDEEETA